MNRARQGSLRERFPKLENDIWRLKNITNKSILDIEEINLKLDNNISRLDTIEQKIFSNRIIVKQNNIAQTLGGVIDSTKEYFIDGIIDLTGTGITIEVPEGGISLTGYSFDISQLICSDDVYTMFNSSINGSGNILPKDISLTVSGINSKVFNLTGATGTEAFEFARVNFNNCTSLGIITNYRQGFETGTGRFGGTPELTLDGVWSGGYFIDSSIVRGLSDGNYSLFKAGTNFTMASRFRSNQNIDLPANVSFFDFSSSNFINPSTIQIVNAIITREGIFNNKDNNITPNVSAFDLVSSWSDNQGLPNTFEGGVLNVAIEANTIINTIGDFEIINATSWTASNLQHYDNPLGNQLRHIGMSPIEYNVVADFTISSRANDQLSFKIRKWNSSFSQFEDIIVQERQVNSLLGPRDVAFFNINTNVELNNNDYLELLVANNSSTTICIAEQDSYYLIQKK